MAVGYAKDQPEGFTNRIENVAIIGVRRSLHPVVNPLDISIEIANNQSFRPAGQLGNISSTNFSKTAGIS
jgi:hypothetical protein